MLTTIALSLTMAFRPSVGIKVEGDGYLQFVEDGHAVYASSARLTVVDGWLSTPSGAPMLPTLRMPSDTTGVDVDGEGNVYAATRSFRAKVGRISLAVFNRGDDLRPYGSYVISSAKPRMVEPEAGSIAVVGATEPLPVTAAPAVTPAISALVPATDPFVRRWMSGNAPLPPELPTFAPRSGSALISVAALSESTNDRYTLGDVAVIDAPDVLRRTLWSIPIGDTPALGRSRKLRKDRILSAVKQAGFDTQGFRIDLPDGATIQRRAQTVTKDEITEVALKAAAKLLGPNAAMSAKPRLPDPVAPMGHIEYVAESCVPTKNGASVIVVTKVNGERFTSHVVKVTAQTR